MGLKGYCTDGDEKLLIYEYMPQGSLEDHLFGKKRIFGLSLKIYDIMLVYSRVSGVYSCLGSNFTTICLSDKYFFLSRLWHVDQM